MKESKISVECRVELVEEKGFLVDYGSLWKGCLTADRRTWVLGYRVFTKSGVFSGLLSENKAVLWNIDKVTLYLDKSERLKVDHDIESEDEYDELFGVYIQRYVQFTFDVLEGVEVQTLKECPRIVAEHHTQAGLQKLLPAILVTEEKVNKLKTLWEECNYKEIFRYCCGSPIIYGLGDDVHELSTKCMEVLLGDVPWAASLFKKDDKRE